MNKLFIGSNNLSKISDWKNYFNQDYEVVTPKDIDLIIDVPEDDISLEQNAIHKAREWAKASKIITLSEDSGFYITELGEKPGVVTKRWLNSNGITQDKILIFIEQLNNKECFFRSVIAVASPNGQVYTYKYEVKGSLVSSNETKTNIDIDYSLGNYFKHDGGEKVWSEMNGKERKISDARLIREIKILVNKVNSYDEIVKDIKNGPEKVKLGFPSSKPDKLAADVFSFASSFQPNNCGLLTTKKDHKNPFKIHEVKAISLLGEHIGDKDIDGYISSGATESNLMAMWIAREKLRKNIDISNIVVLKTKLTHYSVSKATNILHIEGIENIELDKDLSMSTPILKEKLNKLYNRGKGVIIMNTSGYNVTGSSDKFYEIDQTIERLPTKIKENIYLHLDAATLGFVSPFVDDKYKYLKYRNVSSISLDGHKLGLMPYPCGIFIVRKGLSSNISNNVDYLGTQDQTFLGSRTGASASALWAMLNGLGAEFYKNNAQLCLTYKKYLTSKIKKYYPKSVVLDYEASNIVGICFTEMPNNRLTKEIEFKYSLHPTMISLVANETAKYYYQLVITPEIDLITIDRFIQDLSVNYQ